MGFNSGNVSDGEGQVSGEESQATLSVPDTSEPPWLQFDIDVQSLIAALLEFQEEQCAEFPGVKPVPTRFLEADTDGINGSNAQLKLTGTNTSGSSKTGNIIMQQPTGLITRIKQIMITMPIIKRQYQ